MFSGLVASIDNAHVKSNKKLWLLENPAYQMQDDTERRNPNQSVTQFPEHFEDPGRLKV